MKLRKGDICLVNLGGFGHEQTGTRPAIVFATTRTSIAVVIPVTGNRDALRFPHTVSIPTTRRNGLRHDSVALLFHIRAVDTRRIEQSLGRLAPDAIDEINKALRNLLGL